MLKQWWRWRLIWLKERLNTTEDTSNRTKHKYKWSVKSFYEEPLWSASMYLRCWYLPIVDTEILQGFVAKNYRLIVWIMKVVLSRVPLSSFSQKQNLWKCRSRQERSPKIDGAEHSRIRSCAHREHSRTFQNNSCGNHSFQCINAVYVYFW